MYKILLLYILAKFWYSVVTSVTFSSYIHIYKRKNLNSQKTKKKHYTKKNSKRTKNIQKKIQKISKNTINLEIVKTCK